MKKPSWERKLTFQQRKEIIKKHFEKRISQTQLAKEYGVSREMIGRYCRRNGVSPLNKSYTLDDQKIVDMFVTDKLSVRAIAIKLGFTTRPIQRRLEAAGVDYHPQYKRIKFTKEVPHYALRLKIWTAKVIERDGLKCKWCGVENTFKNRLEANHIVPVRSIDNPEMLFDLSNGIALCRKCHMKVHYKEKEFEVFFRKLIRRT